MPDVKVLAMLAALLLGGVARAELRPLVRSMSAVPGAPILVPVRVDGAMREPKVALRRRGERGEIREAREARLAWPVSVVSAASVGRWATSTTPIRLEEVRPVGATDAYLVVPMPDALAEGSALLVDGRDVRLDVRAAADDGLLERLAPRASRLAPTGPRDAMLGLPDPDAPFERFRFPIGVAFHGWDAPPAFAAGSLDDVAAEATTALWLAALARVATVSEGVAAEMAEMLVATCADATSPAPIAAWIATPQEVSALLGLALDPSRDDASVVDAVASWLRVRSPLLAWIDDESPDAIVLALANPSSSEEVVRLQWILGDDPPLAAVVPPAEVQRVRLERPRPASIDGVAIRDDRIDRLRVENREKARTLDVAPASLAAGVAGPSFALLAPPLDLVSVATAVRRTGAPVPMTVASIRPRLDRWEIFVEARTGASGSDAAALDAVQVVGPRGELIEIAADGSVDDPAGALGEGTPPSFARFADRYRTSFTVPPSWIDRSDGKALVELGFRRRVGPTASFDAPAAVTPWRRLPRTILIDLLGREPAPP